jgi:predicted RNA-binding Zn-ribbon protein involved in translation (DUF1610 family)
MSDWWSQKLGVHNSRNEPVGGIVLPSQEVPKTLPQYNMPSQAPHHQQPVAPQQQPQAESPNTEIHMGEAIKRAWKGDGHRIGGEFPCPKCGSHLIYGDLPEGRIHGNAPRMRCFECGWNQHHVQGDQANWAVR